MYRNLKILWDISEIFKTPIESLFLLETAYSHFSENKLGLLNICQ